MSGAKRPGDRSGRRRAAFYALLLLFPLLFGFLVSELAVRWIVQSNEDGNLNVQIRGWTYRLKPYRLPVLSTERSIARYLDQGDSYTAWDPDLGWSPRPNTRSDNGLYVSNEQGIRADTPRFAPQAAPGVLRIVLLGDSYTHGNDVAQDETWAHYLEEILNRQGIPAEIINLGMSAYGMDQALLRWEKTGRAFHPDVVLFGLQPENMKRNLNLFRKFYLPWSGIAFSKPRFILQDGKLEVLNRPTIPPERLVAVLSDFDAWEFSAHEHFYDPANYRPSFWRRSQALALAIEIWDRFRHEEPRQDFFFPASPQGELALAIMAEMERSAESVGAQFHVVSLAPSWFLANTGYSRWAGIDDLLAEVGRRHSLIDTRGAMRAEMDRVGADAGSLFFNNHYTAPGNRVVAVEIDRFLSRIERSTAH